LTPPDIIKALGPFDLDPCASVDQPWETATIQISPPADGLTIPWYLSEDGHYPFVWCNPPYGPRTWPWLDKMYEHRNGIALIFARTETAGFFREVWRRADSLLFIEGRLFFHHPVTGQRAAHNSGGPSVLIGYGEEASGRLVSSGIDGALVKDWVS
jgi:hypothetical protein